MPRIAFADESGTTGNPKCYAIGVVSLEADRLDGFVRTFRELHKKHGVVGEAGWSKIGTSFGPINFLLEWVRNILMSDTANFDAIVVNTELYRNWSRPDADREEAFYKTYTLLLRHIAERTGEVTEVLIDERLDSYNKQHEALEVIGNHMLAKLQSKGRLSNVRKVVSSDTPGVQVADLLTGAIAAAHRIWMKPATQMNRGKMLALQRLAQMLAWPDVCCDTYPHPKFNIWHFPEEFRAQPETRTPPTTVQVPLVDRTTLAQWLTRSP